MIRGTTIADAFEVMREKGKTHALLEASLSRIRADVDAGEDLGIVPAGIGDA